MQVPFFVHFSMWVDVDVGRWVCDDWVCRCLSLSTFIVMWVGECVVTGCPEMPCFVPFSMWVGECVMTGCADVFLCPLDNG